MIFGKVPHPQAQERWVKDRESGAWDDLGQRKVLGVVFHRMEGTLQGTDGWFKRGVGVSTGLTDYGIGNLSTDGASLDGVIYRWNDPTGKAHPGVSPNRAGWASGPVNKPYDDGLKFLQDYDMNTAVVNRDQASIEISGGYNDPISTKLIESLAALTAYWADQAKIPWNVFPMVPDKNYSFVRWHQEFCIGTGKICPGPVVMNATNSIISRAKAILRQYQEETVPATYVKPGDFPAYDGLDKAVNVRQFWAISRTVTVTATEAPQLQYGQPNAARCGAPFPQGARIQVIYAVQGKNKEWYWITTSGARVPMAATSPQVTFQK